MTLLYLDGFDSYNSQSDLETRWTTGAGTFTYATTGRNGIGKAFTNPASGQYIQRELGANEAVFYFGFAYKSTEFSATDALITFYENGTVQCLLNHPTGSGQLRVQSNGVSLGVSTRSLRQGIWHYIEGKITISDSLGSADIVIRVNGENWIQIDSGDSKVSANAWADTFRLGTFTGDATVNYDDLYILNDAGLSPYNTYLGDVRVDSIRPDGNGTTSDFVGSDADSTDNYLHVDDVDPDGDSSYIGSSTVGHIDLHTLGSLAVTPETIFGVQPVSIAKKTNSGTRTGSHVLRTGGTNYASSAFFPSDSSYSAFDAIWEENPNTGVPWVAADLTGLESGIKVET